MGGAGPGAPDLITQRGAALLQTADCIIYAGSLVNPALLGLAKADCTIYNSAEMTLEQVLAVMRKNETAHKTTVRLHTGDPCLYGAIREQMDALDADGIPYEDTPGVSSFCGAAAALNAEYTLPGVSQTVIITRAAGRTPVPEASAWRAWPCMGPLWSFSCPLVWWTKCRPRFCRGLTLGDPRRRGLQSHLAGAKDRALHRGHLGRQYPRGRHYKNRADRGGGLPGRAVRPQQAL